MSEPFDSSLRPENPPAEYATSSAVPQQSRIPDNCSSCGASLNVPHERGTCPHCKHSYGKDVAHMGAADWKRYPRHHRDSEPEVLAVRDQTDAE